MQPEESEILYEYAHTASEYAGMDLVGFIKGTVSLDGLDRTFAEWIITGLCDCTVFDILKKNNIYPDYIAGYSLGLNNACYCSGAITLEDSVTILKGVISSIRRVLDSDIRYGMGVIIGLELQTVLGLIDRYSSFERVTVSSINTDTFITLSGVLDDVNIILGKAFEEGAIKLIPLDVPCAFHSSLMSDFSSDYFKNITKFKYRDITVPIVSVYDQKILTSAEDILKEQQRNFLECMKWKNTIRYLETQGVDEFWDMSVLSAMKKSSHLSEPQSKFKTIKSIRKSGGK